MKIYHNPRCKKSRETLQLIRDKGTEPEIVEGERAVIGRPPERVEELF